MDRKTRSKVKKNVLFLAGILFFILELTGCSNAQYDGLNLLLEVNETEWETRWEEIPEGQTADELQEENEASSEETQESIAEDSTQDKDESLTQEENGATMTGTQEAIALVSDFMETWDLSSDHFSVAYENLLTGETFYYNEDVLWDGCSTYKVPLNLLFYDMEANGEITSDTIIPGADGRTLEECHHQSLEFSNNEVSEAMIDYLGNYTQMRRDMLQYFTVQEEDVDSSYFNHNYFSARMMMDCFQYIYEREDQYEDLLGYLKAAQPGEYFKTYLEDDCEIAQKYGLRDEYTHCAGIIYSDTPFILSVYSSNAGGSNMIGSLAEVFYDYTNSTSEE